MGGPRPRGPRGNPRGVPFAHHFGGAYGGGMVEELNDAHM